MGFSEEKQIADIWTENKPNLERLCNIKLQSHPDEIEDILSDVFLAFLQKVEKDGFPNEPKAWLYATTNNIIKSFYRQFYRNEESIAQIALLKAELPYTEDVFNIISKTEDTSELRRILDSKLKDDEKIMIEFHVKNGLKYKQVAALLGISENAAKQKYYRIWNKIRKITKDFK